jgi:hypothetical protein
MQNECIPFFEAAYTSKKTVHMGYAGVGKTFAGPTTAYQGAGPGLATDPLASGDGGNLLCPVAPTAGGQVSGVLSWDAASGSKGVVINGVGTILPVTVGAGGVVAGALLAVDATGKVVTAAAGNFIVGKAHANANAGADVPVELYDFSSKD